MKVVYLPVLYVRIHCEDWFKFTFIIITREINMIEIPSQKRKTNTKAHATSGISMKEKGQPY